MTTTSGPQSTTAPSAPSGAPRPPMGSGGAPRGGPGGGYRGGPGGGAGGGYRGGGGGGPRGGPGGRRGGRPRYYARRKLCSYCVDHIDYVDYKDIGRLRRFLSDRFRIEARRKSGACAKHQRALSTAIKRARHLAMLPFSPDHGSGAPGPAR